MIHPTALIDAQAEIDTNVSIGAYSIIEKGVKIGKGSMIGPHVVIKGTTSLGQDNRIFQFSSIGEDPQDKKYQGENTRLEIGDRNVIREFVTINRGTAQDSGATRIGHDNLLMAYTHVAHDCQLKNNIIMSNGASLAGHVHIDDYAILSGFTLVHQFCRIGPHSFTGMGSAVTRDVPPFILAAGTPAEPKGLNTEGLKRRGYDQQQLSDIKKVYKLLYQSSLKLQDAIEQIAEFSNNRPHLQVMVEFLQQSQRSIVR